MNDFKKKKIKTVRSPSRGNNEIHEERRIFGKILEESKREHRRAAGFPEKKAGNVCPRRTSSGIQISPSSIKQEIRIEALHIIKPNEKKRRRREEEEEEEKSRSGSILTTRPL